MLLIIFTIAYFSEEDDEDEVSLSDWTLESWLAKKGTVLTEKEAAKATALVPRNMLNFSFNQVCSECACTGL